jgi:hypothetical protein
MRGYVQWGMLQRTNATANSFINETRMLQRAQKLQRMWGNTIGRSRTRVSRALHCFLKESLFRVFSIERLFMIFKFTHTHTHTHTHTNTHTHTHT